MIYSGLDWSEEIGKPTGYMAMVHVDGDDLATLETELADARRRLDYRPGYPFKHTEAKANTHHHFYRALANVPSLSAHVCRYDRSVWIPQHDQPTCGDPCVCDALITLTLACPRELVERQLLYIDYPRRERDVVLAFATALRGSMKGTLQRSFKRISPRPDDRVEGGIVQVADMLAGEVRQHSGRGGPYLLALGTRLHII